MLKALKTLPRTRHRYLDDEILPHTLWSVDTQLVQYFQLLISASMSKPPESLFRIHPRLHNEISPAFRSVDTQLI